MLKKLPYLTLLILPLKTFAYTSLSGIDDFKTPLVKYESGSSFGKLIEKGVFIILSIAVVLAVFMIIRAGYEYMTSSDSADKKTRAKLRIQAALGGLLLAFGSSLILGTINPNLVSFSLHFKGIKVDQDAPTEKRVRDALFDGIQAADGTFLARNETNMAILNRFSDEELADLLNKQLIEPDGIGEYREFLDALYDQRIAYENDIILSSTGGAPRKIDHSFQLGLIDSVINRFDGINNKINSYGQEMFSDAKKAYEKKVAAIAKQNSEPGLRIDP